MYLKHWILHLCFERFLMRSDSCRNNRILPYLRNRSAYVFKFHACTGVLTITSRCSRLYYHFENVTDWIESKSNDVGAQIIKSPGFRELVKIWFVLDVNFQNDATFGQPVAQEHSKRGKTIWVIDRFLPRFKISEWRLIYSEIFRQRHLNNYLLAYILLLLGPTQTWNMYQAINNALDITLKTNPTSCKFNHSIFTSVLLLVCP